MLARTAIVRSALALMLGLVCTSSLASAQNACSSPVVCQDPNQVNAYFSNPNFPQLIAESLQVASNTSITKICWFGAGLQGTTTDCGSSLGSFQITYHSDASGQPGGLIGGPFNVNATSMATGQTIAGAFAEFRFSASHAAVAVTGGQQFWIVILNQSANCTFECVTSGLGAGYAQFSVDGGSTWNTLSDNLAVCIGAAAGSPCGFAFASQDPTTFPSPFAVARMFAQLYTLRDDVMRPTTTGRRWISLYYEHGKSMKRILKQSPRLRRRVAAFVAIIGSGVEALADGNTEARVSPAAVALLAAIMDEFEEADAGGELAQAIQAERDNLNLRRLSGSSYVQAWNEITARADQSLEETVQAR